MRVAIVVSLLAVGACSYRAGSFANYHGRFPGTAMTVGCLDVAIDQHRRERGVTLLFNFGNRCDHSVVVDLVSVRVSARDSRSENIALVPYDPRTEIMRAPIDARMWGRETIEYRTPDGVVADLVEVCAEVGRLDGSQSSSRQICGAVQGGIL